MKCELDYGQDAKYEFSIEPENEMEKCALNYLATRPTNQIQILITRLGLFKREKEDK